MTQQKTHEELKKELAGVVAHFQALLDAMEPPTAAAVEPAPEPVPEPKKEPNGVAQLLATVPASRAHVSSYRLLMEQDAHGKCGTLKASWDVAVQMDGKKSSDEGYARPNACYDSSNVQRVRPSPWFDISCAMRRNETCVLYCKHADDGWTPELWMAAVKHLRDNGVVCEQVFIAAPSNLNRGDCPYYCLHWEAGAA